MSNETALAEMSLIDNPEERTLCALIIDCSGSMAGKKMSAINQGLKALEAALKNDPVARSRVRLLVIECGGNAASKGQWFDAIDFVAPQLIADGLTPLGQATHMALDELDSAYDELRRHSIQRKRPWVFLFSDGEPSDTGVWEGSADRLRAWATAGNGSAWIFGAEGANMSVLQRFAKLDGTVFGNIAAADYGKLFVWLSASTEAVAKGTTGTTIDIGVPVGDQIKVVI